MGILDRMGFGGVSKKHEKISADTNLAEKLRRGELTNDDLIKLAGENEEWIKKMGTLEIPTPDKADEYSAWLKALEDDELSMDEVDQLSTDFNKIVHGELSKNRSKELEKAVKKADETLAEFNVEEKEKNDKIKKMMEE